MSTSNTSPPTPEDDVNTVGDGANSGDDPDWRDQQIRDARKRAALLGLGGGLLMSLLMVGACVLLILAGNS